jgi:hypothetical protein
MSTQSPQLDQADRELLVAYLDGELSAEDSAVLESRLAGEAALRQELQELQQAWDALGELPRPVAAEGFTRTTLEMVAVAAQEDAESATLAVPVRRKRRAARLVALVVAGSLIGVLLARVLWPDENRQILQDLPIIENIEPYRHVGSVDFLVQLHERLGDRLARVASRSDEEIERAWHDWQEVSAATESVRRERIADLEPAAAGTLQANWKRFNENTSPEEKARLRELHEKLLADPRSQELFATLARFGELLHMHSNGDKVELRSKGSPAEQLAMVREWVDRLDRRRPDRLKLSAVDTQRVLKWFRENRRERRGGERREPSPEERRQFEQSLEELWNSLSPQTQELLSDIDGENRWRIVYFRLREAVTPSLDRMDDALEEFFVSDELSPNEKLELLLLPEWEMWRELGRRYPVPFFGDGFGRGRGGGRRGGRPDGPPPDGGRERRGESPSDGP